MQVTYELNQRDFYDSFIAHRNRNPIGKWAFRVVITIVFGFAVLGVFGLIARPSSQALSNLAPLMLLAGFWAVLVWVAPWRTARSQYRKQPSAHGPRSLLVDDLGVHWRWNCGTADIEWKNLIRWQETKTLFLLYSSPACFNIVPKRGLGDEDVASLRSLLAEHIPAKRGFFR